MPQKIKSAPVSTTSAHSQEKLLTADKPAQPKAKEKQPLWLHDPLEVTQADVSDNGTLLAFDWVDFIGQKHHDTVNRDDCYFNFPTVLRLLVHKGFRYNTLIDQAPALIQLRFTSFAKAASADKAKAATDANNDNPHP